MNLKTQKIRVSEAAKILGVTAQTLRNWEKSGKLLSIKSKGNQRYYDRQEIEKLSLNIEKLALSWATSELPFDLPLDVYCERQDRFTTRLGSLSQSLLQSTQGDINKTSLLTLVAGEIGDNSFAHNIGNWTDKPGIFFEHDSTKRIIVLADRGRGVKNTLQNARPDIKNDVEALTIAFTEIVSGRNPEKRGNGLKVSRKVIEDNNFTLYFASGFAYCEIRKGKMQVEYNDRYIRGAFVIISY